jgi:hypothetical protein
VSAIILKNGFVRVSVENPIVPRDFAGGVSVDSEDADSDGELSVVPDESTGSEEHPARINIARMVNALVIENFITGLHFRWGRTTGFETNGCDEACTAARRGLKV